MFDSQIEASDCTMGFKYYGGCFLCIQVTISQVNEAIYPSLLIWSIKHILNSWRNTNAQVHNHKHIHTEPIQERQHENQGIRKTRITTKIKEPKERNSTQNQAHISANKQTHSKAFHKVYFWEQVNNCSKLHS